eukprot:jgi/Phyca11/20875/fgenesh1_pg.PHYCAscaffold_75_\
MATEHAEDIVLEVKEIQAVSELRVEDQGATATEVSLDAGEKADDGANVDKEQKKDSVTIEEQKPPHELAMMSKQQYSKQQLSSNASVAWQYEYLESIGSPLDTNRDTEDFLIGEDWMYDQGVKIDFVSGEMKWYEDNTKKVVPFTGVGTREQRERVAKIRLIHSEATEHGNVRDLDADDR